MRPKIAYMKLAREGRKFGIGLVAVTQLISVIPEEILHFSIEQTGVKLMKNFLKY